MQLILTDHLKDAMRISSLEKEAFRERLSEIEEVSLP